MKGFFGCRQSVAAMLILTVIGIALIAAGCGTEATANGGPVKLTQADNGKSATIKAGEEIQISLQGNPTTGFEWMAALSDADKAIAQQVGEATYVQASTDPSVLGSGGTYTFTFKALKAGTATIKLVYQRSWEDVQPEQTYTVTITVQ